MSQNILPNNQSMDNTMGSYSKSVEGMTGTYDTTTGTTTYGNGTSSDRYNSSYSNNFSADASGSSNKLMKGVLIGATIGGVLAMLDSNTRSKVKDTAVTVKDSSMNVISEVKNNPTDVKDQMMNSFKEASNILKEAISDAQTLYQRLNEDVFAKMGDVKSMSSDALNTVVDAKGDLMEVGAKVKEAGASAMDNPVVNSAGGSTTSGKSSSASSSNAAGAYATGMDSQPSDTPGLGNTSNTFAVYPEDQNNDSNR